ncbi:unnamed protein product, partial [Ilex paraguariensis]
MARMGKSPPSSLGIFELFWGWLLLVFALGAFSILLAHTKQMGPVSPPQAGIGSYKRAEELGSISGEQRKKKRNDPRMESIKAKNVTCEWQVDRPTHGPHDDVVRVIE